MGLHLESQGVTWVCHQRREDPGDPREKVEETRLRDTGGAKRGTESSSLGWFSSYYGLAGLALVGKSWDQLLARSSSGKKEDRGALGECF